MTLYDETEVAHPMPMRLSEAQREIARLLAERDDLAREVKRLREAIQDADEMVTMEINPSNYNHDDVCLLNDQMIEAMLFLRAALKGDTDERA